MLMSKQKKPQVKEKVRYLLWAKSAGRCEFNGCNEPLYQDSHTKIEMNFGEVAHIIGQGKKGPRSYEALKYDEKYINDIANLMLACPKCHKLIDGNPELYTDEKLRGMKFMHEDKVRLATAIKLDNRSNVIIYSGRVGLFQPSIKFRDASQALFPDYYPADHYAHELSMSGNLETDDNPNFWKNQTLNLEAQFKRRVEHLLGNEKEINHFSIFAFAPIPLLIILGTLLPDHYPADIYQLKKEPPTWDWQPAPQDFDFIITEPEDHHQTVALNMSLSADIDNKRIFEALGISEVSIWKIDATDTEFPKNDHLRSKDQLILFSRYFRKLLNQIKIVHGQATKLHVFPAISVAYAVEIGRIRQQKADVPLLIYDQNNQTGGFSPAIAVE